MVLHINLKVMMRDIVRNIESFGDWSGSLLMEIYVIYDNATECPKQKTSIGFVWRIILWRQRRKI